MKTFVKCLIVALGLTFSMAYSQVPTDVKIENILSVETFPANDVYYNRVGVWNYDSTAKPLFFDPSSKKTINTPSRVWAHRYIDLQGKEIQEWAGGFCFTREDILSIEKINDHVLKLVFGLENKQKFINKEPGVKTLYEEAYIDFQKNTIRFNSIIMFQGHKWTCVLFEPNMGKFKVNRPVSR